MVCVAISWVFNSLYLIAELEITPIPVALDNYAYIIMETESNTCVVIDVGDEEAVIVRCLQYHLYDTYIF